MPNAAWARHAGMISYWPRSARVACELDNRWPTHALRPPPVLRADLPGDVFVRSGVHGVGRYSARPVSPPPFLRALRFTPVCSSACPSIPSPTNTQHTTPPNPQHCSRLPRTHTHTPRHTPRHTYTHTHQDTHTHTHTHTRTHTQIHTCLPVVAAECSAAPLDRCFKWTK